MAFTAGSNILRWSGWIIAVLDIVGLIYWVIVSIWAASVEADHLLPFILGSLHIAVPATIFLVLALIWDSGDEDDDPGVPHWRAIFAVIALFFFYAFADILLFIGDVLHPETDDASLTTAMQVMSGIQVTFAAIALAWGIVWSCYVASYHAQSGMFDEELKRFVRGGSSSTGRQIGRRPRKKRRPRRNV